jgi:hypothetical protein
VVILPCIKHYNINTRELILQPKIEVVDVTDVPTNLGFIYLSIRNSAKHCVKIFNFLMVCDVWQRIFMYVIF